MDTFVAAKRNFAPPDTAKPPGLARRGDLPSSRSPALYLVNLRLALNRAQRSDKAAWRK